MSLSRLALRLAACEALAPFASSASGPWPTLAGREVYDSRIDPIAAASDWEQFLARIDGKPIVILSTEDHETVPFEGAQYPAEIEMVDLFVEIMIAAGGLVEVVNPDGSQATVGQLGAAVTDRQREALLDLLEGQIRYVLSTVALAPSAALFRQIARECHHVHSVPQREVDKTQRVAARTMIFKLRVPQDQWPAFPASPAATGLGLLPQPLQQVATALDPTSSGGVLCATLATLIGPPAAPTALGDIRLSSNLDRVVTPTLADDDVTGDVAFS